MSDVSNQWRGMRARSMGQTFEAIIDAGCAWYRERGLAYIEKTPEPMRPLRAPNSKGQFLACYTKAAQPDYKGTILGGRSIVIEAKHTDSGRIDQSRTSSEQMEALATLWAWRIGIRIGELWTDGVFHGAMADLAGHEGIVRSEISDSQRYPGL